ncbi:MAG: histidine kinase dimerization/phospho-acceptor domain-containing protein, partial [Lachnospiraceae bacterium]|nr:histidine kinase dimerization/phospho-acceptor domain-containing protein [Lachnospiraceae bacterium]
MENATSNNQGRRMITMAGRGFCLASVLLILLIGYHSLTPVADDWFGKGESRLLTDGWVHVTEDGNQYAVSLPEPFLLQRGETYVLERTLPYTIEDGQILRIYSNLENISVSVDGSQIAYYGSATDLTSRRVPPEGWLTVELKELYAGKTIRITYESGLSFFRGVASEIYYGDDAAILFHLLKRYGFQPVLGILFLLFGIFYLFVAFYTTSITRRMKRLIPFGMLAGLIGAWFLCDSVIRQFYFSNGLLLHNLSYVLVMLYPIALVQYANLVEKRQYQVLLYCLDAALGLNFFINTYLHLSKTLDLTVTFNVTALLIVVEILLIIFTAVRVLQKRKEKKVLLLLLNIMFLSVFGFAELLNYYYRYRRFEGLFLGIGMMGMVISAALETKRDLIRLFMDKKKAVASNEAKSDFLASMSHEIRTPLNAICGMADIMAETDLDPENHSRVETIKTSAESLLGIVDDILDYAKLDSDTLEIVEKELGQSFFSWDCHHIVYWLVTPPLTGWKSNAVRLLPTAKNSRTI